MKDIPDDEAYTPALAPFFAVADGIALLFAPYAEVVVHDLATEAVVHIANPVSRRRPGDPSQLEDVEFAPDKRVIGPYEKTNWDGRRMKCISVVLNTGDTAIGLLCINVDVTQFEQVRLALEGFLLTRPRTEAVQKLFQQDWHEQTNQFIADWCARNEVHVSSIDRSMRRELIGALKASGLLDQRRAPAYVARILGVSRATIYNELAAIRQDGT